MSEREKKRPSLRRAELRIILICLAKDNLENKNEVCSFFPSSNRDDVRDAIENLMLWRFIRKNKGGFILTDDFLQHKDAVFLGVVKKFNDCLGGELKDNLNILEPMFWPVWREHTRSKKARTTANSEFVFMKKIKDMNRNFTEITKEHIKPKIQESAKNTHIEQDFSL